MNKNRVFILLFIIVIISFIFIKNLSFNDKKETLPNVVLKDMNNTPSFAIMVEDGGSYIEAPIDEWPDSSEFIFNDTLSGCMDSKGNLIPNSLQYDSTNDKVNVTVDSTSNCYMYFDEASR